MDQIDLIYQNIKFDYFRKSVKCYKHNNMELANHNNVYIIVISIIITVNFWKCILLSYSPLNSYLYHPCN